MPTLVTIDLDALDWTHKEAADLLDTSDEEPWVLVIDIAPIKILFPGVE